MALASLVVFAGTPAYADNASSPPSVGASSSSSIPSQVSPSASSLSNVTFPIPQLGNCSSKNDCETYCNQVQNMQACIQFGEAHGLLSADQANQISKLAEDISSGKAHAPEDCKNMQSCKEVCEHSQSAAVIAQCVKLGEETGAISKQDAAKAQAFLQLLQQGKTPGGCDSKDSCETYCQSSSHSQECMAFFQKMEALIPDSEKTSQEKQQLETMIKFQQLIRQNATPGGCTGQNSCQAYCANQSHFQECAAFAQKMGFVSKGQQQMLQQTGGKGPGGCDSEDSCAAFCNQPQNQQTCMNFAQQTGVLDKSDANQIKDAQQGLKDMEKNSRMPDWVKSCLEQSLGSDAADQIAQGNFAPSQDSALKIGQCMQKDNPQFQNGGKTSGSEDQMPMMPARPGQPMLPNGMQPGEFENSPQNLQPLPGQTDQPNQFQQQRLPEQPEPPEQERQSAPNQADN